MTGANYMGGKRNAAKARTRDSMGRIQRGFFGRQRLNILSKGIPRRTPDSPTASIPVIELAHAPLRLKDSNTRERFDGRSSDDGTGTFVTVLKTPESSKTKGSSSPGMARSRVLDVLDTKEPMFLRATLNRILTLPDLAGLSGTGHASKRHRVEEYEGYEGDERKRKKTIPLSNNESQLFYPELTSCSPSVSFSSNLGTGPDGNRDRWITKSTDHGLYAPPEDDELLDHFQLSRIMSSVPRSNYSSAAGLGVSSLPPSSEQTSSSDIIGTLATGANMDFEDQNWDDLGLDLDSELQDAYEQSPIPSMIGIPQDNYGDEIAAFHESPRRCPRFAENNLYEHQDPWHTIGVVLGLSPVRPDDRILDGASEEQDVPFARFVQSLFENEGKSSSLNGDVSSGVQNSDKSAPQQDDSYVSATEDEFDDGIGEDQISAAQVSRCALQQNSPSLFTVQEDPEERVHGTRIMTMNIDFEVLPHVDSPSGPVRTPSSVWKSQSPFRVLLESKRKSSSSVNSCNLGPSRVSGSSAASRSSPSRSQSSLALRTPSPRGNTETQSPFRMLLAARNLDQKKNLNLTDYSLGDSVPSSSPDIKFASSMALKEIDGVFQGPCLFPENAYDASDEDCIGEM